MTNHCPHPGPTLDGYPIPSPLPCHTGQPHIGTATHGTAFTGGDVGGLAAVVLALAVVGTAIVRRGGKHAH